MRVILLSGIHQAKKNFLGNADNRVGQTLVKLFDRSRSFENLYFPYQDTIVLTVSVLHIKKI